MAWKFLIDSGVVSYPLDLVQVIRNNGWEVKSYQKLGIAPPQASEVIFTRSNIIILFDERIQRRQLRFYIAHEIGHIVLKHYNFEDYKIYERETKMFARRVLMPITLIHNLGLHTVKQIVEKCDVTYSEAEWRLNRYFETLKQRNKFDTHPLEMQLKRQLGLK